MTYAKTPTCTGRFSLCNRTSEFIIMGLLPDLAHSFQVSIPKDRDSCLRLCA